MSQKCKLQGVVPDTNVTNVGDVTKAISNLNGPYIAIYLSAS